MPRSSTSATTPPATATADGESADTDAMYWCLKCRHRHRCRSSIGRWHEPLQRPTLHESGGGQSTPSRAVFAAGVALALALRALDQSEVTIPQYCEWYRDRDFDDVGDARPALDTLRDQYNDVIIRRHSGREWATFEVTGTDHIALKRAATEYATRGMSWGVRHD